MPKNKITDLRNHLFETLERLKDEENPMDVSRALAISAVAGTIIESAKAEIKFMEATGDQVDTDFFELNGERALASKEVRGRLGRG